MEWEEENSLCRVRTLLIWFVWGGMVLFTLFNLEGKERHVCRYYFTEVLNNTSLNYLWYFLLFLLPWTTSSTGNCNTTAPSCYLFIFYCFLNYLKLVCYLNICFLFLSFLLNPMANPLRPGICRRDRLSYNKAKYWPIWSGREFRYIDLCSNRSP